MLKHLIGYIFLVYACQGLAIADDWEGINEFSCGNGDTFEKAVACMVSFPDSIKNVAAKCLMEVSATDFTDIGIMKEALCGNGGTGIIKVEDCFIAQKNNVLGTLTPDELEKLRTTMACVKAAKQ